MYKPYYFTEDGTKAILTPSIAKSKNITYGSKLYVDIVTTNSGKEIKREKNVYIDTIPLSVKSKYCVSTYLPSCPEEHPDDRGCYLIIDGIEKIVSYICDPNLNEIITQMFINRLLAEKLSTYSA